MLPYFQLYITAKRLCFFFCNKSSYTIEKSKKNLWIKSKEVAKRLNIFILYMFIIFLIILKTVTNLKLQGFALCAFSLIINAF